MRKIFQKRQKYTFEKINLLKKTKKDYIVDTAPENNNHKGTASKFTQKCAI